LKFFASVFSSHHHSSSPIPHHSFDSAQSVKTFILNQISNMDESFFTPFVASSSSSSATPSMSLKDSVSPSPSSSSSSSSPSLSQSTHNDSYTHADVITDDDDDDDDSLSHNSPHNAHVGNEYFSHTPNSAFSEDTSQNTLLSSTDNTEVYFNRNISPPLNSFQSYPFQYTNESVSRVFLKKIKQRKTRKPPAVVIFPSKNVQKIILRCPSLPPFSSPIPSKVNESPSKIHPQSTDFHLQISASSHSDFSKAIANSSISLLHSLPSDILQHTDPVHLIKELQSLINIQKNILLLHINHILVIYSHTVLHTQKHPTLRTVFATNTTQILLELFSTFYPSSSIYLSDVYGIHATPLINHHHITTSHPETRPDNPEPTLLCLRSAVALCCISKGDTVNKSSKTVLSFLMNILMSDIHPLHDDAILAMSFASESLENVRCLLQINSNLPYKLIDLLNSDLSIISKLQILSLLCNMASLHSSTRLLFIHAKVLSILHGILAKLISSELLYDAKSSTSFGLIHLNNTTATQSSSTCISSAHSYTLLSRFLSTLPTFFTRNFTFLSIVIQTLSSLLKCCTTHVLDLMVQSGTYDDLHTIMRLLMHHHSPQQTLSSSDSRFTNTPLQLFSLCVRIITNTMQMKQRGWTSLKVASMAPALSFAMHTDHIQTLESLYFGIFTMLHSLTYTAHDIKEAEPKNILSSNQHNKPQDEHDNYQLSDTAQTTIVLDTSDDEIECPNPQNVLCSLHDFFSPLPDKKETLLPDIQSSQPSQHIPQEPSYPNLHPENPCHSIPPPRKPISLNYSSSPTNSLHSVRQIFEESGIIDLIQTHVHISDKGQWSSIHSLAQRLLAKLL
jgi:hypothetical protein